jgi:CDP-diacylglycerol--glycerol-3-phosphate 3-phosphatidyltransferase
MLGGFLLLRPIMGAEAARRWLALAGAVLAYQGYFTFSNLAGNRRAGEVELLPSLGAGNALSLARGTLLAMLAGFLLIPPLPAGWAWAPAVLYTLADLSDYLDGYLARIMGHSTLLGERLDIEWDGLGTLAACALAVSYGKAPPWFLLVGMARYIFLITEAAMGKLGRRPRALPPSGIRRPLAGLTMGFLSVLLWPVVHPPASELAALLFAVPFLLSFMRDWLVVVGVVDPLASAYQKGRVLLRAALLEWAPIPLRLGLLVVGSVEALRALKDPVSRALPLSSGGFPGGVGVVDLFALWELAALLALALGFGGRFAALIYTVPVGLTLAALDPDPWQSWALGMALALLILGTGRLSLWAVDKALFSRPAGAIAHGEEPGL